MQTILLGWKQYVKICTHLKDKFLLLILVFGVNFSKHERICQFDYSTSVQNAKGNSQYAGMILQGEDPEGGFSGSGHRPPPLPFF